MRTLNVNLYPTGLMSHRIPGRLLALFMIVMASLINPAVAQTDQAKPVETSQKFGDYTVHFSVFNSTFITPEVAKLYQLTRGGNQVLVNISLTKTVEGNTTLGLPAVVSGTATNLIQQQRALEFKAINEGEATYYLAPLRHTNEEVVNFVIQVQAETETAPFTVRFNRTLHTDD